MPFFVRSSCYRHPVLGPVRVKVVASSKSIRARWEGQELHVTIPPYLTGDSFGSFIESNVERFLEYKPKPVYAIGSVFDGVECDFEIVEGQENQLRDTHNSIRTEKPLRGKEANYFVHLRPSLVESRYQAEVETCINRTLIDLATAATRRFVLPRARALAAELGCSPQGWDVKHHKRDLGTCSAQGVITLGSRLIFLPHELRDYVICHELAHLTEMNHSQRFHAICNKYCNGREKALALQAKKFRFPVF